MEEQIQNEHEEIIPNEQAEVVPELQKDEVFEESKEEAPSELLSERAVEILMSTVPWMKFIGIMGFIGCGFMIIAAFAIIGISAMNSYGSAGFGILGFFLYLILAVILFFPPYYLFNYAQKVKRFYDYSDSYSLEEAFEMQKRYWVYLGVLVIIYLSIMVLFLIFGLGAGLLFNRFH